MKLHKRDVDVVDLGDDAGRWASRVIGREAKLVVAPHTSTRRVTSTPRFPSLTASQKAVFFLEMVETGSGLHLSRHSRVA